MRRTAPDTGQSRSPRNGRRGSDAGSTAGVGNDVRMDFQTVTIFADGRVALSFLDSTTHYPSPTTGAEQPRPALAIELR